MRRAAAPANPKETKALADLNLDGINEAKDADEPPGQRAEEKPDKDAAPGAGDLVASAMAAGVAAAIARG